VTRHASSIRVPISPASTPALQDCDNALTTAWPELNENSVAAWLEQLCSGQCALWLMRSGDFLHGDLETPLCEHYIAAGAICRLSTNCELVLAAARSSFLRLSGQQREIELDLRFWVDEAEKLPSLRPKPYVRGLDHLVFVGIDAASSILADLHSRRVIGRFSAAVAKDSTYWKAVIFPVLMSVVAGSVGIVELHASCVAVHHCGLALIGSGRSGKSTLAMALAQLGFSFVSDDRTFCSLHAQGLSAYGLPRPLKLREDAAPWFQESCKHESMSVQNGERVFYCEPNRIFGRESSFCCRPRLLLFLERQQPLGFCLTRMESSEARSRITADLLREHPAALDQQHQVLDALLDLPCWRLQYNGRPQVIAQQIVRALGDHFQLNNSLLQCQCATT
jgi:hypothetical protein